MTGKTVRTRSGTELLGSARGMTSARWLCVFLLSASAAFASPTVASATVAVQTTEALFLIEGFGSTKIFNAFSNGMGVSPDGEEVVFTPGEGPHNGDLMIYDIPEEEFSVVSSSDEDGMYWKQPRFAPSGTQIVASSDFGLYAIDTDGTHIRRLTGNAGEPSWPVMSSDGYLAYLDNESRLWVLNPSTEEAASEPRLIATLSQYDAEFANPPSFGVDEEVDPEECEHPCEGGDDSFAARSLTAKKTDLLLYPTDNDNYIFNVTTGKEVYKMGTPYPKVDWNTLEPDRLLEGQIHAVSSIDRFTGAGTLLGSTPEGSGSIKWVRSNQPPGEVSIPHVEIPEQELLHDFRPYLQYDSQEPYGAVPPWAITDVYGWNEAQTKVLYTNRLRREGRTIAEPPYQGWWEEGVEYSPIGWPLTIDNLGGLYPSYSSPDISSFAFDEDAIDEHNGTHQADSARFYERGWDPAMSFFRPATDGAWLQYFFFYYYNNGQVGVDDHEGDWEMIQVHLNAKTGYLPSEVVYAHHSHANSCQLGEYETEGEAPGRGGAPVVYVANGTHASYPTAGEWLTDLYPFVDSVFPDVEEWPSSRVYLLTDWEEMPTGWLKWPGKWGGSEASPPGPEFQGSRWDEPGVWASEAASCHSGRESGPSFRMGGNPSRGSKEPLGLTSAVLRGGHLVVRYRLHGIGDSRKGWPRMLLSADSPEDGELSKVFVVKGVSGKGKVVFPFRLNQRQSWIVKASIVSEDGRTTVVRRLVVQK